MKKTVKVNCYCCAGIGEYLFHKGLFWGQGRGITDEKGRGQGAGDGGSDNGAGSLEAPSSDPESQLRPKST
ncbi:hypothetical protein EVAR_22029_1 [Eumeta japonica]|uniref:Uncharacterized protein n=1 Tax=Eumeta variegata TaxID=151549 RepID=A0A4C1UTQ8_EUMVA|nr:hypothetical protein EVAR_22029_1 [Eumeta japonica]